MSESQTPQIKLDVRNQKVWCITKFLQIGPEKFKTLEKHDITVQVNNVLDEVYLKALDHHRKGIYLAKRTKILFITGPSKREAEFNDIAKHFTAEGWITMQRQCLDKQDEGTIDIRLFNGVNFRKIDIADMVYVVDNKDSTSPVVRDQIYYAANCNKTIIYHNSGVMIHNDDIIKFEGEQ